MIPQGGTTVEGITKLDWMTSTDKEEEERMRNKCGGEEMDECVVGTALQKHHYINWHLP
jgi:hypothetical protein